MLAVTQLIGFGVGQIQKTIFSNGSLFGNVTWSSNVNFRTVFNAAALDQSGTGLSLARVTLSASTAAILGISSVTIGVQAGAGDVYDFQSTPTQLFFGGSASVSIPANTSATTDWAPFTIPPGANIIVAFYANANPNGRSGGSISNVSQYYSVSANATTTANVSSYTLNGRVDALLSIETSS